MLGTRPTNVVFPEPAQSPQDAPTAPPAVAPPQAEDAFMQRLGDKVTQNQPLTEQERQQWQIYEAQHMDALVGSLYPEVYSEGPQPAKQDVAEAARKAKVQAALKFFAWACSTAGGLSLPMGASVVLQGLGAIFNQFLDMAEVAYDVVALFVDLALLMEIMNTLERSGGFAGENLAFWKKTAGKLHMAVLSRAVKEAKTACFSSEQRNVLLKFACAGADKASIAEASEKLDRARRYFVESITTRSILSDATLSAVEVVYKKHDGNICLRGSNGRTDIFYPTEVPHDNGGFQCMAFNKAGQKRCENRGGHTFNFYQDSFLPAGAARPDGLQSKTWHVCGTHCQPASAIRNMGAAVTEA